MAGRDQIAIQIECLDGNGVWIVGRIGQGNTGRESLDIVEGHIEPGVIVPTYRNQSLIDHAARPVPECGITADPVRGSVVVEQHPANLRVLRRVKQGKVEAALTAQVAVNGTGRRNRAAGKLAE